MIVAKIYRIGPGAACGGRRRGTATARGVPRRTGVIDLSRNLRCGFNVYFGRMRSPCTSIEVSAVLRMPDQGMDPQARVSGGALGYPVGMLGGTSALKKSACAVGFPRAPGARNRSRNR